MRCRSFTSQVFYTGLDGLEDFKLAIAQRGLLPPADIVLDGTIHRFSTTGKPDDLSGWYCLYDKPVFAGAFGCWRTGISIKWRASPNRKPDNFDWADIAAQIEAKRRVRDEEKANRHTAAAIEASRHWSTALDATGHPYLLAKGVAAHGTRIDARGFLLVPMRDVTGKLWNLERINPADFKDKKGLYGGRRTSCYFSIGTVEGATSLCVAEGFATAASLHQATRLPVAAAFNAGNLLSVATALRTKFPKLALVICADNDSETLGNPGLSSAIRAAKAVGGRVAIPHFGSALI
ncbi:putative DNA primase/helicase [Noviherbaspirillum humi]|uniref:Putative DNA primase/helicase n=1 Tax=Noviherbaspirillum humi TaxID=1688639 RepID=A0A239JED8_9BURK|nr:toprim domain-containing protein [Noviherbaspirillum humi]SNT03074.1 putative DNA primase/helicase [Noviherbaspirillum humi]